MMMGIIKARFVSTVLSMGSDDKMTGRIFGLDMQLIVDACILAVSIFVLFTVLSYLLFEPARKFLEKRQEFIQNKLLLAEEQMQSAMSDKIKYEEKIQGAEKEIETMMESARKSAKNKELQIIKEANEQALEIKKRTEKELELEKEKFEAEGKKEMILVAASMAGKIIKSSLNTENHEELYESTLKEMGEITWQNRQ